MVIRVLPLSLNLSEFYANRDFRFDREFEQSMNPFDIIEEEFTGDWRKGQEIKQVVITKRFYQVSSNSSQA